MSPTLHMPQTQDDVLDAMMTYVPSLGWSLEALQKGALEAGLSPEEASLAFQGDLDQALRYFIQRVDVQMKENLAPYDLPSLKVRERIETGVMTRLNVLESYRQALPKIFRYQLHPSKMSSGLKALWDISSEIWYEAGDISTDFNYYSKRTLLSGVYASTFLFWLKDSSPDFRETKAFLGRRIASVMKIPSLKQKLKQALRSITPFCRK